MITIDERRDLTASQLDAQALELRTRAAQVWADWETAGRPAEHTNSRLETPRGWWPLIIDAQDYEQAADDARWRIACRSAHWRNLPAIPPESRRVLAAAYWEVSAGRRQTVPKSMFSGELAVRPSAPVVATAVSS